MDPTLILSEMCLADVIRPVACDNVGALGGTRTPNLLIRSQVLYPLSYERKADSVSRHRKAAEAPGFEPGMGDKPKPH